MSNVFKLSFRIYRINEDDNSVTIILEDFLGRNVFIRCPAPLKVLLKLSQVYEEGEKDAVYVGSFGVTYQKGLGVRLHLLEV